MIFRISADVNLSELLQFIVVRYCLIAHNYHFYHNSANKQPTINKTAFNTGSNVLNIFKNKHAN